ncbi:hypothetical protein [Breoghania sp.]|uniref:hypothetical protein n=1 Tax=Breoghania sp. TaxID=2065378 RepID=UPI0026250EDF|nr:hypothetical protein [Breoghania sp.]MDJ0931182.1 hypothetical protein [Breoghania sp.]
MKKAASYLSIVTISSVMAGSAMVADWLEGTYVNQDADSLMKEAVFCDGGKAYAGMGHRIYTVEAREGTKYVVLQSDGKFTFSVSDDGQTLSPADDFTKEWFTKTGLKKDPKRTDTCNW